MNKYQIQISIRFKTQRKKLSQADLVELDEIITKLANDEKLEHSNYDHDLTGNYKGFRECHIKPNLCLIYQRQKDKLILYCFAIGSHGELFKK